MTSPDGETNQGGTLFKGENLMLKVNFYPLSGFSLGIA
jgi:hypothetical protein